MCVDEMAAAAHLMALLSVCDFSVSLNLSLFITATARDVRHHGLKHEHLSFTWIEQGRDTDVEQGSFDSFVIFL